MQTLPIDIEEKISSLFAEKEERKEATRLIFSLWTKPLNVGEAQLARSILVLCDGSIPGIKKIIDAAFYGDPRDIIVLADRKVGNPGHYFINGF